MARDQVSKNLADLPARARSPEASMLAGRESFCHPRGPAGVYSRMNHFGFSVPAFPSAIDGRHGQNGWDGAFGKIVAKQSFKRFTIQLQNCSPFQESINR
jgi:hypothetical protein